MKSILEIKSLTLPVKIGLEKAERSKPQDIVFNITIYFSEPPLAEYKDSLQGSVCYFQVCGQIKKLVAENSFALIEKLARDTLDTLKPLLPKKAKAKVAIHKLKPPVPCLKGGVVYTCQTF